MTWMTEWRALAARIEGLGTAADDLTRSFGVKLNDRFAVVRKVIEPSGDRLLKALRTFLDENGPAVPALAASVLDDFLKQYGTHFATSSSLSTSPDPAPLQVVAALRAVRAELDYYFADNEIGARRIVERAFLHLQRSLVADEEFRRRWANAGGEVAGEKLGALHLLGHGVWAFKADAAGARTDLILGRHLSEDEPRASDVEAFVLTEWKITAGQADAVEKVKAAHVQLGLYRRGALGGFELSTRRYVVIVADQELELPPDHDDGGVRCRHILLNRGGETPAVSARRRR